LGQDQDLLGYVDWRCGVSDTPKTETSDKADTITRRRPIYKTVSDTPRTDAHTRQLIDELQHPHWIEFAGQLERENDALREYGRLADGQIEYFHRKNVELRADKKRLEEKLKELRAFNKYYRSALKAAREETKP